MMMGRGGAAGGLRGPVGKVARRAECMCGTAGWMWLGGALGERLRGRVAPSESRNRAYARHVT